MRHRRLPRTDGQRDAEPATELETAGVAQLIADGSMPFPVDLAKPAAMSLMTGVSALRRKRLLQFLADVISRDLQPQATPLGQEDSC